MGAALPNAIFSLYSLCTLLVTESNDCISCYQKRSRSCLIPFVISLTPTRIGLIAALAVVFVVFASLMGTKNRDSELRGGQAAMERAQNMDHYNDYNWIELPTEVQEAATTLGYNQNTWDDWDDPELFEGEWSELTHKEKSAAQVLGYSEEIWCMEYEGFYSTGTSYPSQDNSSGGSDEASSDASTDATENSSAQKNDA